MKTVNVDHVEVHGLAARQAETVAHTAMGLSAKETARVMAISPRTVEMHLSMAMQRLGARNRVHLITKAVAAGAIVIRETKLSVLALISLIILASTPLPGSSPDDLMRLTARPVRPRRDDAPLSITGLEDDFV